MDIMTIPGFAEPFSSLSHLASAGLFLVLTIITMYRGRGNAPRMVSLWVFGFFATFLFSMSGVYHLLTKGSDANFVLRVLDHTAIFTMIAGSFTPFHMILLRGVKRWLPLVGIWTCAITGLTLTAVFFSAIPEWVLLTLFLTMGWMGAFTYNMVRRVDPGVARLLMIGALFYTAGALADHLLTIPIWPGIIDAHELFHVCIIIAALCHWRAIHRIADYPLAATLTLTVRESRQGLTAYLRKAHEVAHAATLPELQQQIGQWMHRQYPSDLIPEQLVFRFFREEQMWLEKPGQN